MRPAGSANANSVGSSLGTGAGSTWRMLRRIYDRSFFSPTVCRSFTYAFVSPPLPPLYFSLRLPLTAYFVFYYILLPNYLHQQIATFLRGLIPDNLTRIAFLSLKTKRMASQDPLTFPLSEG